MQGHFAFGGIGALPGAKATGFFHVPGTSIAMPLTVINGVALGPTLLVTAGMHGGEYPSIEAAMRFAAELVPAEVSGQVVVIPRILAEAGQQGRRDAADTLLLLQGCRNVARLLGLLPGGHLPGARPQMLERIDWVRAEHRGCWYPAVTLRERIAQGHIIGRIKDYFGNVVAEYWAPHSGIVVLSCTSLAVREHHTLVGVGLPPEQRPA